MPDEKDLLQELEGAISKRLGSCVTHVVSADEATFFSTIESIDNAMLLEPLSQHHGGFGSIRRARVNLAGVLVVDNTVAGSVGCAAIRQGADVCFECLGPAVDVCSGAGSDELVWAVSVKRGVATPPTLEALLGRGCSAIDALALREIVAAREIAWHKASDNAQVAASYLRCHPNVAAVRYPGIPCCEDYMNASSELQGGFGPILDVLLLAKNVESVSVDANEHLAKTYETLQNDRITKVYVMNDNLLRVICGTENPRELVMNLEWRFAKPQVDEVA